MVGASNFDQSKQFLEQRIEELEQQVAAYDALLNELPDLFERKFQERLAPILDRYKLLSEHQKKNATTTETPLLQSTKSPDNVVRFPVIKLLSFLRARKRSA